MIGRRQRCSGLPAVSYTRAPNVTTRRSIARLKRLALLLLLICTFGGGRVYAGSPRGQIATRTVTQATVGAVALTPAYVQGNNAVPQSPKSAVSVGYPHAQAAGDLDVVAVGWNDTSATVTSVTDSAGNSYQVAVPMGTANGLRQAIYYARNIAASSADIVTVTFSQAATYPDVRILEYANLDRTSPFDAGATGAGSGSMASSGSATTQAANELLIGAGMTVGAFTGAGSGYTTRMITSPDADIAEDRVATAAGSYSATAPVAGAWLLQVAAFRPATSTSVAATATQPASTSTPVPPAATRASSPTATRTAVPATATSTSTRPPASATRTSTPVPATASATRTAVPATASSTATPVVPTATSTATQAGAGAVTLTAAYVQGAAAVPQGSQATVTVSFPNPQAAGDLDVVAVGWNDTSATVTSVTDSAGNSYQVAVPMGTANGLRQAIYYARNIAASSTNTVIVTFNQAAFCPDIRIMEYANLDRTSPFDAGATNSGTGSMASSGSAAAPSAQELLVGVGMTVGAFTGAGSGYTTLMITSPDADIAEDQVAAAAGSYSATAPVSGAWLQQVAAFRPATTAAPASATATGTGTPVPPSATASPSPPPGTATPTPAPGGGPSFPLAVSADHRSLVDQRGTPVLIVGDSPQDLIGNISLATAATYFADRQAQGFNAVWVNFPCGSYTWCNGDGSTYDGLQPFTTPGDFSTPNPAYFQRGQQMVALAAQYGFVVFLNVADTGSWLSLIDNNGQRKDYAFGQYLGTTFAADKNVIFMVGNDFQSWTSATDNTNVLAILQGIASTDPGALRTSELSYWESTSLDAAASGQPNSAAWGQLITLDGVYTYSPTYEHLYADAGAAGMPMFIEETNYEYENNTGGDPSTPLRNRKEDYWGYLAGAAGYVFGNNCTSRMGFQCGTPLGSTWQSNIDSPGARQLSYCAALLRSIAWYDLVPDTDHAFLTAGYGTPDTGNVGANDYVTAALTADGTTGLMYDPNGYALTVDLARMAGPVTARWFDPSDGTYVGIAGSPFANSGSHTFTPPGSNSGGDPDWVLLLQAGAGSASSPTPPGPTATPAPAAPAFVQVTATTPQSPQTSVSLTYPQAQGAGDTNVVVIGWNDTTSTIRSVVDSAGNTYQIAAATARGNGISQAIYYAGHIAAAGAGANTVTITFNQAAAIVDVRILEYSGLDQTSPFDVSASASGTSATASSGAAATSAANELIVGAGTTTGGFSGAGPGFTSRIITAPDRDIGEDQTVTTVGSYGATAPLTGSAAWVMQMATFRAAS